MVDVRGDVLRPPHGTTPAAVKSNIKSEMRSFRINENIHKKEGGSYYVWVKFSSEVHNRSLRSTSENLLYVPKPNMELYRNSLAYSGSKIWNSIPEHIRNAICLQQFRHKYLSWMGSNPTMKGTRWSFHFYFSIEFTLYRCIYLKIHVYSFYFLQILLYVWTCWQRTTGKIGLVHLRFLFK